MAKAESLTLEQLEAMPIATLKALSVLMRTVIAAREIGGPGLDMELIEEEDCISVVLSIPLDLGAPAGVRPC